MNDRIATQREAVRRSLQLRRSLAIPREHAINVFDVASSIGIDVQFLDLPSLEGMFYRGPDPKVILPSLKHRPRGRVAFSCAHELGHFDLGHGTRVDEYIHEDGDVRRPEFSLEELAADTFASTLLMPRPAVLARFSCRGWTVDGVSAIDLYRVAVELDVGYGTLCKHLQSGLGLVNDAWMKSRAKFTPKALRAAIAPRSECLRLVVLDQHSPKLPVDLEVGDCLALPALLRAQLPSALREEDEHDGRRIFRAAVPGEIQAVVDGHPMTVRIARSGYCGLLKYRYLEEEEDA